MNRKV